MIKNFMISMIIRPSEICRGPKCGFTLNIFTSFMKLKENFFYIKPIHLLLPTDFPVIKGVGLLID